MDTWRWLICRGKIVSAEFGKQIPEINTLMLGVAELPFNTT